MLSDDNDSLMLNIYVQLLVPSPKVKRNDYRFRLIENNEMLQCLFYEIRQLSPEYCLQTVIHFEHTGYHYCVDVNRPMSAFLRKSFEHKSDLSLGL